MENQFSAKISEGMQVKRISGERLSQITGVSERYINSIISGRFSDLPAIPYARGYVFKIAEVLELEPEKLWTEFLSETGELMKRSGSDDRLPNNRFAGGKKVMKLGIFFLALLFVASVLWRTLKADNPQLHLDNPEKEITITTSESLTVRGRVRPDYKLTVNDEEITTDGTGSFSKEVKLNLGPNTLTFTARRPLSKNHVFTRQIIFEPEEKPKLLIPSPVTQPSFEETVEEESQTAPPSGPADLNPSTTD